MGWIIERGMVPVNCEIAIFDLKGALAPQDKPLMLQPVLFCPVLTWAAQELMDCGVQRYFIVCPEKWRQEVLDDLPGCDVTFFDHAEAALSAAGGDVVMVPGPVVPVYGPEDGRSVYAADSQVRWPAAGWDPSDRLPGGGGRRPLPVEAPGLAPAFRPFDSAAALAAAMPDARELILAAAGGKRRHRGGPRRHLCGTPGAPWPRASPCCRGPSCGDTPPWTGTARSSQLHAPGLPDRPAHHRECLPAQ